MTAEVAILNKNAVALAADSAVTLGHSNKIYNSAHKLFQLSKIHPVGVMVYGNAHYMGVPYETIIKSHRSELGKNSKPKLENYAEELRSYLSSKIFSSDAAVSQNIFEIAADFFSLVNEEAKRALLNLLVVDGQSAIRGKHKFSNMVAASLKSYEAKYKVELESNAGDGEQREICPPKNIAKKFEKEILQAAEVYFSGERILQSKALLLKVGSYYICRPRRSRRSSGIVVAGFGQEEFFPSLCSINTDGMLGEDIHKYSTKQNYSIGVHGEAAILPFAQPEMVRRFMEGADPKLIAYFENGGKELLSNFATYVLQQHIPSNRRRGVKKELEKVIIDTHEKFLASMRGMQDKNFVSPILQVLTSLPKEELGHFADALVSLTSLKRRVSMDQETVGGPVDVAVISKGDGFVWIKRKFYFKPELNPYFFNRYAAEIGE